MKFCLLSLPSSLLCLVACPGANIPNILCCCMFYSAFLINPLSNPKLIFLSFLSSQLKTSSASKLSTKEFSLFDFNPKSLFLILYSFDPDPICNNKRKTLPECFYQGFPLEISHIIPSLGAFLQRAQLYSKWI